MRNPSFKITYRKTLGCGVFYMLLMALSGCMGQKQEEDATALRDVVEPEIFVSERIDGQPAGCWATVEDYEKATGKKIDTFHQSPILDGRDLPPVEERLPDEPLVVKPVESIGKYGGTLRILTNSASKVEFRTFTAPASILSYDRDYRSIAPGLAKSWELSPDGRELTLHFRKGLKWSDGVPFTTDDVLFWWEDVILNDELTPVKPAKWKVGGELMKMKKLDDYTLRLSFKEPYPVIVYFLPAIDGTQGKFYQCKHYMKQFHPNYTDREEVEKNARKEGARSWVEYFKSIEGTMEVGNPNRMRCPTMLAHVVKEKNPQTTILERNPYYWKVDPDGNQLPYIDRVVAYSVESEEVYKLKITAGEVDFDVGVYTLSVGDIPTLKKNEKTGNYRTLLWKVGWSGLLRFAFNLNCPDPVKREIFNNFKFRKAMSLAIDRDTMNDSVLFQRGVPCQTSVLPEKRYSKYYVEEYTRAYIEYDPDEANRLLDEIGLDKRDKDGFRLMPDGRRLTVVLSENRTKGAWGSIHELVTEYWADVGLELIVKAVDASIRRRFLTNGNFDIMATHTDHITDIHFTIYPSAFVPIGIGTGWGPLWSKWYDSGGKEGEKPPQKVLHLFECLKIMYTTMNEEKRIRAGKEILKSQAENLWNIGTVGFYSTPLIANKHLRNIPDVALWTWDHFHTAPLPPEAFYFDNL